MIDTGKRTHLNLTADDPFLTFTANKCNQFFKQSREMSTTNSSRQLSPGSSPQAQQDQKNGTLGQSNGTSGSKQTGQASVLIEYFERSSVPRNQQKPSIRVQLHTSPPKGNKKMTEPSLSEAAGSSASVSSTGRELPPMNDSSACHPVLYQFDLEAMSSPILGHVPSITRPPSRPQLSIDSSASPVNGSAYPSSGPENVSSPDTSQSYDNSIKQQVGDRSENSITRSTNRSIKYDPDLLDNIISDVIRRLVLPELASIKLSTSGGAAIASQIVTRPANSTDVPLGGGSPSLASHTDISSKDTSLVPDSVIDISKIHIVADPDSESSPHLPSNEGSISHFPEKSDYEQETCSSVLNMDNPTFTTCKNDLGEPMRVQNDSIGPETANTPVPPASESHDFDRCHITPSTCTHLTDDTASDGDAPYFSSEEYPRPLSATQTEVDRMSQSAHIPTNTILSDQMSSSVDRHHGRQYSEFSFESGPDNISSDSIVHSHVMEHDLTSTKDHLLDINRGNTSVTDISSVTGNTRGSPHSGASVNYIDSSLGIHYLPEDPHSYAPWLKHMEDPDQDDGSKMIQAENNITTSSPISKRNRIKSFDDCVESPTRVQTSVSAIPSTPSDPNRSLTNIGSDRNLGSVPSPSRSPKPYSERILLRGERQRSQKNYIGTAKESRIKGEETENNESSPSNDYVNQYMTALVDKLVANDVRRNQRDTEILTGVARLAAELRMGLDDIHQKLANENQLSRDEISRIISFEVSKIRGPRPYQPPQKNDSPAGPKQAQRKNILLRAFGGIKSNSDLERVENLYVQVLTNYPTGVSMLTNHKVFYKFCRNLNS
ncbi:hypothetical protein V1509DRAFT_563788 [Lipomyces kononenkoae]